MTPLQAVDLGPLLIYLLPMAGLIGLYVLVVFGLLPRRVRQLRSRVDELEDRVEALEDDDADDR